MYNLLCADSVLVNTTSFFNSVQNTKVVLHLLYSVQIRRHIVKMFTMYKYYTQSNTIFC